MRDEIFHLKEEHLKLIQNVYIYFDEYGYEGAPAVDIKRPYGNSRAVAYEVYRVLHDDEYWDSDKQGEMPQQMYQEYVKLHRETAMALQICVRRQSFEVGTFRNKFPFSQWEKVDD